MIAHACAARVTGKNVYSVNSSWLRFRVSPPHAIMSSCDPLPPPPPSSCSPLGGGFQIRPQQWGAHASSGCHASVSAVGALMAVATVSRKPGSGAGLDAGALAGGIVGAHYLGLGHHSVFLLRESVTVYGEKEEIDCLEGLIPANTTKKKIGKQP